MGDRWLLFFHIVSAITLVGGLAAVTVLDLHASGSTMLRWFAFWTNVIVVIPSFLAVHVLGSVLADREYPRETPGWLDAGFVIADIGFVVNLALAGLQGWSLRRARLGRFGGWQQPVASVLAPLLLLALLVAVFLMAGKPGA